MALRRKIDHHIRLFRLEKRVDRLTVCNIRLYKPEARIFSRVRQCFQVARIGQCIHTNDLVLRVVLQQIVDKVASDKSGSACYQSFHCKPLIHR